MNSVSSGYIRRWKAILVLVEVLLPGLSLQTVAADKILIVAPHPDDEALGCAGIIKRAIDNGDDVKVVIIFDGERKGDASVRRKESINAMSLLGLSSSDITFLDFPDGKGLAMWKNKTIYNAEARNTFALNSRTSFNWSMLISDLKSILLSFDPTYVYSINEHDEHGDHSATSRAVKQALSELGNTLHWTVLYGYLIHWEDHDDNWPGADKHWPVVLQYIDLKSSNYGPGEPDIEVMLPPGFTQSDKLSVINNYRSQLGGSNLDITEFAKSSEIFWDDGHGTGYVTTVKPPHQLANQ
jgi:LmbE family N-acetylglucosaminyl deacetylase